MLETGRTNPYFFAHATLTELINMEPGDMIHEILHHFRDEHFLLNSYGDSFKVVHYRKYIYSIVMGLL